MPELPEVETVARQLAPSLVGRTVRRLQIFDPRLDPPPRPGLAGRRIREVRRSGKQVLFALGERPDGDPPLWLAVHLRMTGRLSHAPDSGSRDYLRARLGLDRGSLLFHDVRRFGTFRWYRSEEQADPPGVDPLDARLTSRRLAGLIDGSTQNIKSWLLRQDRLVGLGNIYASEILHASCILPSRPAGSLEQDEVRKLHKHTRRILRRAIQNCGTTFSDFQDARGVEGSYQELLAVYGRDGEPCRRCGDPIQRTVQQQRSTFYCSGCQS